MLKSQQTRAAWAVLECPECKTTYRCPRHDAERRKFCSEECKASSESRKWANAPERQRAQGKHSDGYVTEYVPRHPYASQGYVLAHRVVMEKWLRETGEAAHFMVEVDGEKYLRQDIDVHHRNEKMDDNRRANLVVCTKAAHNAIHHARPVGQNEAWPLTGLLVDEVTRKIERTCIHCAKTFVLDPSQMRKSTGLYCSRDCYDQHIRPIDAPGRIATNCQSCGTTFMAKRYRVAAGTVKFCSDACRITGLAESRRINSLRKLK